MGDAREKPENSRDTFYEAFALPRIFYDFLFRSYSPSFGSQAFAGKIRGSRLAYEALFSALQRSSAAAGNLGAIVASSGLAFASAKSERIDGDRV